MANNLIDNYWFWGFWVFFFGACLGSFANVVIYRLPKGESVVTPRSKCPKCSSAIAWYDNIPVFSWLILWGKCRKCKAPVSWRYPVVELVMALTFLGLYLQIGWSWTLVEYWIFAFGAITASFIDFDHMILPDVITLPGLVIGLVGAFLSPERGFMDSLLGVLMGGGFLWAIAYLYFAIRKEEGMGGGDIKLLGWIGAVLGWKAIPFVILSSSITGSVVGFILMSQTKKGLKTVIPFGPYLAFAALLYMLGGHVIGQWYLDQFFSPATP